MPPVSPKRAIHAIERRIALVAGNQHGVITLAQLVEIGLSPRAISHRVAAGRLHRIHRGVYAVGHASLSREGTWIAAVLACGDGAVLSHRSAAMHWGMLRPSDGPTHVTVPTGSGRHKRSGITVHRSSTLLTSQTTIWGRIPVTKPTRTLADLRRTVPTKGYRRALRQAEFLRLPIDTPTDRTRSKQEADFLALCRRHRIPPPEVNRKLGPYTVDFLWRAERLVVEADSWSAHGGRLAYHEDRERDLWLKLRGFEVVRFTHEQITCEPAVVAAALRKLLRVRRAV